MVKKVIDQLSKLETYQARFKLFNKYTKKTSYGNVYYKTPNLVHFSFVKPHGALIISNGQKMWLYSKRLNAVAVQDLDTKDSLYATNSKQGMINLFKRYHYHFKSAKQPISMSGKSYYVLSLKEKTNASSFPQIELYIHTPSFLISKLNAVSSKGHEIELSLTKIKKNPQLSKKLFRYEIEENVKVVENPLTVK